MTAVVVVLAFAIVALLAAHLFEARGWQSERAHLTHLLVARSSADVRTLEGPSKDSKPRAFRDPDERQIGA